MLHLTGYISEKLHLDKDDTKYSEHYEMYERFLDYFKGVPEKELKDIFNRYVINSPFDDEAKDVQICTTFELLFMLAAMLIDDGQYYNKFGVIGYKTYTGSNNPYNLTWFEETFKFKGHEYDILTYIQDEWIVNNMDEWINIYNLCKRYKITIKKIEHFYDVVECGEDPE